MPLTSLEAVARRVVSGEMDAQPSEARAARAAVSSVVTHGAAPVRLHLGRQTTGGRLTIIFRPRRPVQRMGWGEERFDVENVAACLVCLSECVLYTSASHNP